MLLEASIRVQEQVKARRIECNSTMFFKMRKITIIHQHDSMQCRCLCNTSIYIFSMSQGRLIYGNSHNEYTGAKYLCVSKVHESRCQNYRQQQNVMAAGVRISYIQTPPTISIKVHFPILAEIPWHANLH